jgi:ABC-type dipeptide/oligopeptide/nickel transport system ATPase subunit
MLSRIKIKNFKSFAEAEIRLRPLTVMIGANASGKTNFIEALGLLGWMAKGRQLSQIHSAVRDGELRLRGSLQRLTQHANHQPIGFVVDLEDDVSDPLHLELEISIDGAGLSLNRETLTSRGTAIYTADPYIETNGHKFLTTKIAPLEQASLWSADGYPLFAHAYAFPLSDPPDSGWARLAPYLAKLVDFRPIPDQMRGYVSSADRTSLRPDGANLSAVLHHLCQQDHIERILEFVQTLPEQDIRNIDFIQVPERDDVMVKLLESFGGQEHWQEAAVLSDGTLRALAIAAALWTSSSLLIIEDIDDGVHPSRLGRMLELIRVHAEQQNISVLVTTHNPALLDAIPDSELRHVVACYRDPEQGDSRLIELGQLNEFPALVAQGPLGQLVTQGIVDRALKHDRTDEERAADALAWLAELEASE